MISKAERRKEVQRWTPKPSKGHLGSAFKDADEMKWAAEEFIDDLEIEPKPEAEKSQIEKALEFLGRDPKERYGMGKRERQAIIQEYKEQKALRDGFSDALAAL